MTKRKSIRQKGKIQFSEYFKELKLNDKVAIVKEKSIPSYYPERMVGSTGVVIGNKGKSKIVRIMDGNLAKDYIVHPIHLKRLR
ncbi:50S ribosomal protein L21e [uncultured archaeon]|nr:50S ribosomal protein L21e [uncultured archaeon]